MSFIPKCRDISTYIVVDKSTSFSSRLAVVLAQSIEAMY